MDPTPRRPLDQTEDPTPDEQAYRRLEARVRPFLDNELPGVPDAESVSTALGIPLFPLLVYVIHQEIFGGLSPVTILLISLGALAWYLFSKLAGRAVEVRARQRRLALQPTPEEVEAFEALERRRRLVNGPRAARRRTLAAPGPGQTVAVAATAFVIVGGFAGFFASFFWSGPFAHGPFPNGLSYAGAFAICLGAASLAVLSAIPRPGAFEPTQEEVDQIRRLRKEEERARQERERQRRREELFAHRQQREDIERAHSLDPSVCPRCGSERTRLVKRKVRTYRSGRLWGSLAGLASPSPLGPVAGLAAGTVIDESRSGEKWSKFRCSACGHSWKVRP